MRRRGPSLADLSPKACRQVLDGIAPAKPQTESHLHRACENALLRLGYVRRTTSETYDTPGTRGTFVHLNVAKCNPILLDFLILGFDGRYLEIEIKRPGGRVAAHQQALLDVNPKRKTIVDNYDDFLALVLEWESEDGKD